MNPLLVAFLGGWEIILIMAVIVVPLVICGLVIALCICLRKKKVPPPLPR